MSTGQSSWLRFFGFFRLSNIAPHTKAEFDSTKHITGGDVFFLENEVRMLLKWSKTIQFRDQYKLVVLPKLGVSSFCPYQALKQVMSLYNPSKNAPLFQITIASGWQVLTDSRVKKNLEKINQCLHLPSNFYTFHAFRWSGASLAYELGIPVREIKEHGTWASDCVWTYIPPSASAGCQVSHTFRKMLHDKVWCFLLLLGLGFGAFYNVMGRVTEELVNKSDSISVFL